MITLHRPERDHTFADEIEERLKEMVVAHKVERYEQNSVNNLPFLQENDKKVFGESEINQFLEDLERELYEQRMVTSDSCYIDPQTGELC